MLHETADLHQPKHTPNLEFAIQSRVDVSIIAEAKVGLFLFDFLLTILFNFNVV